MRPISSSIYASSPSSQVLEQECLTLKGHIWWLLVGDCDEGIRIRRRRDQEFMERVGRRLGIVFDLLQRVKRAYFLGG